MDEQATNTNKIQSYMIDVQTGRLLWLSPSQIGIKDSYITKNNTFYEFCSIFLQLYCHLHYCHFFLRFPLSWKTIIYCSLKWTSLCTCMAIVWFPYYDHYIILFYEWNCHQKDASNKWRTVYFSECEIKTSNPWSYSRFKPH